jgi:hypothetical protein
MRGEVSAALGIGVWGSEMNESRRPDARGVMEEACTAAVLDATTGGEGKGYRPQHMDWEGRLRPHDCDARQGECGTRDGGSGKRDE